MMHEVTVFLSAMGSGAIAGFIYDLFRLKRKALKTKAFIVGLEDVIFWVFTALLVFTTATISNQGEVRLYFIFAAFIGVVLYYWLLSLWVIQILTFFVKVMVWPFAFLVRVLKPVARWIAGIIGKSTVHTRKRLKTTRVRIHRRLKSIHHIMRKV